MAGMPVTLERQNGASWSAVASATTGAAGRFAIDATLAPGAYRVRFDPGGGLEAGYSSLLAEPEQVSSSTTTAP
jgi:5-hydroxyisourate hydrolase-like protein (transthyretin family)